MTRRMNKTYIRQNIYSKITEPVAGNESTIDMLLDVPNRVLQHIGLVMVAVGVAEYHLLDSRISAMPLLGLLILTLSALVGIETLNRWVGGQTERSSAAAAKRSQLLSVVLRIDPNSVYIGSDPHNPSMHNLMTAKVAEIPQPHSQPNTDTSTRAAAPPASTEGGPLADRSIRDSRATVQGMTTLDAENIDPRDPTGELLSKMTELYPNDGPVC
ncbi:hypothetical protein SARC_13034 [Sphaeroforma arctica JP610]|uniref:Uncharacterized protein n=1 Tax=Sphaeroforma arctica JP610 TaxID=667725 RepID=A0A0L0FD60_9EUKA|nr:hypothetical protein SARC_13034 [Sphaeroforma arctica JP610]KNC74416.1 hypothetical protein SARC_13034 [Sphaeroforma arctica JP610]|eukprot:XP_014148318.1 hypothetical protein SARC_13034 [Sphaeroforma arctica JP610]